jgi:UDP-N-acetylglucosamine:LPS N-acetylglucosamine transferase
MDHPEKIKAMREAIGRIRKPNACYDIAKLALEM